MRKQILEWVRTIVGIALFTFVLKTVAFATYYIPSESMMPTLEVGDRLVATKFDYGYSRFSTPVFTLPPLPTEDGRVLGQLPRRGEIALFSHPYTGETIVKRVIGLPGDRIQITNGRLFINDVAVERRFVRDYGFRQFEGPAVEVSEYDEVLPGGRTHRILIQSDDAPQENTLVYTVPSDHLFMMGDNRDNSADSRFASLGYVPVENLIGRSRVILFSLHTCEPEPGLTCAARRYLEATE